MSTVSPFDLNPMIRVSQDVGKYLYDHRKQILDGTICTVKVIAFIVTLVTLPDKARDAWKTLA